MPLLLLTRYAEGSASDDGPEGTGLRAATRGDPRGTRPPEHFYRHVERSLDLSFVRDLVRQTMSELIRA